MTQKIAFCSGPHIYSFAVDPTPCQKCGELFNDITIEPNYGGWIGTRQPSEPLIIQEDVTLSCGCIINGPEFSKYFWDYYEDRRNAKGTSEVNPTG